MIDVLNLCTATRVPMVPTAEPDVHHLEVHGERFVFDANSLLALHVDAATGLRMEQEGEAAGAKAGPLLWSRFKPNVGPANPRLHRLCLNLTHECNLACDYCFNANRKGKMSRRDIRRAWRLLPDGCDIDVAFFGGEPLLAWDELVWAIDDAHREAARRQVATRFHVTTNGTLLDPAKVVLLTGAGASMIVSIDGPECEHDRSRRKCDGSGSFEDTLAGLAHVRGTPLAERTLLRSTFNTADVDLRGRLEYLNNLCDMGYASGVAVEPAFFGSLPQDIEALRPVYHEASEWYVARVKAGKPARYVHYRIMLDRLLNAHHAVSECGGSCGYLAVDPDGSLHACHVGGFPIGHLDYGIDEEARAPWCDGRLYRRPVCMKCPIRYVCGGGCRLHNQVNGRALDDPDPARCAVYRIWFDECLWIASQLTPEERRRAIVGKDTTCAK